MKKENKKQNIEVMVLADKPLIAKDKASERILEIALTAPEKKTLVERVPLNLSLVIDRSGSMDGEKLEYVKKAAAHVVDLLSEKDRVAVVIYDDTVEDPFVRVAAHFSLAAGLKAVNRWLKLLPIRPSIAPCF